MPTATAKGGRKAGTAQQHNSFVALPVHGGGTGPRVRQLQLPPGVSAAGAAALPVAGADPVACAARGAWRPLPRGVLAS